MRLALTGFILGLVVLLTACSPMGNNADSMTGTTGFISPQGDEYITNGDTRVDDALAEPEQMPPKETPQKKTAPKATQKPLRERLKEFEISRYNRGQTDPQRFGEGWLTVRIIFQSGAEKSLNFKGNFTGSTPKFSIDLRVDGYSLTGELVDSPDQTKGDLILTHLASGDNARLFYWAYRAKLKALENKNDKPAPGSAFENQLGDLRSHYFGWVNNWSVLRGPSFFIMDFVKQVTPDNLRASNMVLSIKGPSLRTGDKSHKVDEVSNTGSQIELFGNAEEGTGRMFLVQLKNPIDQESHEIMLSAELDEKYVKPTTPKTDQQGTALPEQTQIDKPVDTPEEIPEQPEAEPPQEEKQTPSKSEEPVRVGKSFLRVSTTLPRTVKMTKHFNANRNLKGVKDWINAYASGKWHAQLQRFYNNAHPFRMIMEKVGIAFDVSPAYAYLTVIESAYFTEGKYEIEGNNSSSALGPFQLLSRTAKSLGLSVGGKSDERRFFVPSSCGAAKYIGQLVNKFDDSDATLAILGYFQGDGGAAAAIYCSFDSDAGNRAACVKRINSKKNAFGSKDYGRFLRLANSYPEVSYAEMDRLAAISKAMREYVNKKLAIYFISNDMTKFGFNLNDAKTSLPNNGTVLPKKAMNDRLCTKAVEGLF